MFGTVLLILLALMLLVGLGWLLYALYADRQRQARTLLRMRKDAERQERAIIRLSEGMNASLRQVNQLSQAMEARQERMRQTLDGRLSESFRQVNAHLNSVHRGLGEMREITTGMTDLKKMLGGVKTRGVWGEVQLRALMADLFAPGQYVENAAIPAGSQPQLLALCGCHPHDRALQIKGEKTSFGLSTVRNRRAAGPPDAFASSGGPAGPGALS